MCFRYVDDTFVIIQNEKKSEEFLIRLNGLHFSSSTCGDAGNNLPHSLTCKANKQNMITVYYKSSNKKLIQIE